MDFPREIFCQGAPHRGLTAPPRLAAVARSFPRGNWQKCPPSPSHLATFDVDELLLGEGLVVDGVGAVLGDVLLNQPPFVDMVGDRGDAGVLGHLVGNCSGERRRE